MTEQKIIRDMGAVIEDCVHRINQIHTEKKDTRFSTDTLDSVDIELVKCYENLGKMTLTLLDRTSTKIPTTPYTDDELTDMKILD